MGFAPISWMSTIIAASTNKVTWLRMVYWHKTSLGILSIHFTVEASTKIALNPNLWCAGVPFWSPYPWLGHSGLSTASYPSVAALSCCECGVDCLYTTVPWRRLSVWHRQWREWVSGCGNTSGFKADHVSLSGALRPNTCRHEQNTTSGASNPSVSVQLFLRSSPDAPYSSAPT